MITGDGIKSWTLYGEALPSLELLKMSMNMLLSAQSVKKRPFIDISFTES